MWTKPKAMALTLLSMTLQMRESSEGTVKMLPTAETGVALPQVMWSRRYGGRNPETGPGICQDITWAREHLLLSCLSS